MIVDIQFEDGDVSIAKILSETEDNYEVCFLLKDLHKDLYYFDTQSEIVPRESVSGFYDVSNLEDTGLYTQVDDKYYETGDDSDYSPSDTETDFSCSDTSLDEET